MKMNSGHFVSSKAKKLLAAMVLGVGIASTSYALDDVTYTMYSTDNGNVVISLQNNTVQRIVLNRLTIVNANKDNCLNAKDFIIEPNATVTMTPFNQNKCFGIDNKLELDSADFLTTDQKDGNVKEDIRIQTQYTRGFQPDPYSTNKGFSLFFK